MLTTKESIELVHSQEYKNFSDELLEQMIRDIERLNGICEASLENCKMYLKWIENDLNSLYDKKLDELSDMQIAREVRSLVSRRDYYRKEVAEYELYILANNRLSNKVFNELTVRVQEAIND